MHNLIKVRRQFSPHPLVIQWSPAHLADDIPDSLISPSLAHENNTTVENIVMNKKADRAAKSFLSNLFNHDDFAAQEKCIVEWHLWLANLAAKLASYAPSTGAEPVDASPRCDVLKLDDPLEAFQQALPRWAWDIPRRLFTWLPNVELPGRVKLPKSISKANWDLVLNFFATTRWYIEANQCTSFLEMVYHLWFSGVRLEVPEHTPAAYCTIVKKVFNLLPKVDAKKHKCLPSVISNASLTNGKVHPCGFFRGARMWCEVNTLKTLAVDWTLKPQGLKAWSVPF